MINAYPKNTDPVKDFLTSIGVAKVDAAGQATGTTGGNTFMWQDQQAQYQKLLAAQQPQAQPTNAFLDQPAPAAQPAPMAGNTFLSPVGDVRINGLTPATLAPGGTPMVGRDYGVAPGGAAAPVGGFGALARDISLADGPVKRNGALFEYQGAGRGFSLTQDPSTVPAAGAPRMAAINPDAAALAYRGLSSGMDRATFQQLLAQQGAVPNDVSLNPMEQAARAKQQADLATAALSAYDRVASAGISKTAGQSKDVQANRDQTFLKLLGLDKAPMADAAKTGEAKVEFSKNKDLYGTPKKDNPPTYIEYLDMRDQIEAKGDKATPQEKKRLEDLNKIITKMQTQSDVFGSLAQVLAGQTPATAGTDAW